MIQHFFEFESSGHGEREILEPGKFRDAEFLIEQPNGRWGRDVAALGAGNVALELYASQPEHYFELMLFNRRKFGFQAIVRYKLKIDGVVKYTGQVDFATMSTDGKTIIEFTVIEITEKQIFNRRFDIKTNLFSNTRLDESDITPVATDRVLLKSKPITRISKWNTPSVGNNVVTIPVGLGGEGNFVTKTFNFATGSVQYDIHDSLNFMPGVQQANFFGYIEAQENLENIVLEVSNLTFTLKGNGNGISRFRMKYFIGTDDQLTDGFAQGSSIILKDIVDDEFYQETNATYIKEFPFMDRNQKLYLYFTTLTNSATNFDFFSLVANIINMEVKITATSIGYNSVIPMARLFDAMRYNALSSSNLDINAPRWDFGGELYDQYITTQPLMRGLIDKPFNISTKDIAEEYLPEVNGDYQIQEDGTIFYGIYRDFYRDYQIANFSQEELSQEFGQPIGQIVGYKEDHNMPYLLDKFNFKYKHYQSQKETQEGNTYDAVHGESEWYNLNDQVEDTKNVEVGFIRDPFMIEGARRKAFDLDENTATQDDDKIYIVDVVSLQDEDRSFTETALITHIAPTESLGYNLELRNNQTFSWTLLGIGVGDTFTINSINPNQGNYIVVEVSDVSLKLITLTGIPTSLSPTNTRFTYVVNGSVTLVNRTNEGFETIENIADGNNFANLRFSVKRNILNYYGEYLASTMLFNPNKKYKNSLYKNNPEAVTKLTGGEAITEGSDFIPVNPILDTFVYEAKIVMTLDDYLNLMVLQKQHNGYVRTFDSTGLPLKGFIKKGVWIFENAGLRTAESFIGVATFTLESMYQEFYLQIIGATSGETMGMIVLSNGESASDFNFYIENEILYIFDETGKQLFVPVPFNRVKVNNSTQAATPEQLEQWLNLLKP